MHGSIGTFGQTANIPSDIEAAREEFDFIVEGAKQLVDQGKDRQAVERLRLAADFAHIRHTGKFSSVAIEQLLDSIGQRSVAGSHTSDDPLKTSGFFTF